MRSVSHKGTYVMLQFSGNSPARLCFFSSISADFVRRIGASEISEHRRNWKKCK